jgi:probable rRNA maturation factor
MRRVARPAGGPEAEAMSVTVELTIEDPSWTALGDVQCLVERAVEAALAEAGVMPEDGTELSCLLCDDPVMRALNQQWRGTDRSTNVLSFPAAGPGAERMLGDIVLAYGTVSLEAAVEGRAIQDHVAHLIVHGTLHLVGQDHEAEADAEAMEALEIRAMARLGLADPYAGSVPERGAMPLGEAP